jgi:CTP:molybdopterin cytidylyltransferase MocA
MSAHIGTTNAGGPASGTKSGIVVVLLAAGGGSRFDGPTHKLLADLGDGSTVAGAAIGHAIAAAVGDVVVVTGAVDLDEIVTAATEAAAGEPVPAVSIVRHSWWADGQASTLQVGVAEAERRGARAVVVGLADQPFVDPEAWRRVAAGTAPIAVATYEGRRRNPVRLDRSVWPLLPTSGDEGARSVLRVRPELVEEIPCPGSPADIDTLEDLASWQNRSSTNSP